MKEMIKDNMKNILVFSSFYKPHIGGVEKYIENFYKRLPNHKVTIITSKYDKSLKSEDKDENLNIVRIDSIQIIRDKYYIPTLNGSKKIKKLIKSSNPNKTEVHTHTRFYFTNVIATYFAKKYNLKHYHFEHGSSFVKDGSFYVRIFAYIFDKTFAKYILKNSQLIFPVSESVRDFLNKNYKNIKLGPTMYNSYDFKNVKIQNKKKPKLLKLLFVGRIIRSKGIYELVDSCKFLSENNIKYSLTIIGDGSERENLEKYIKKNNIKNIVLKGQLPYEDTQKEYSKYNIFVNPSYTEGLPTTVLEALANNLIVIATDAGGTKEIIPENKLIKLNELSPPEIIAEHIISSWNNWDKEQENFKKIFINAKNKFDWKKNINKYYSATNHT